MILRLSVLLLFWISVSKFRIYGQDCNKLGAWLWYIEITGFDSHKTLADTLHSLGVKRIYVKVADGKVNTQVWPELTDTALVNIYKRKDIEPWAWSYNYPGNENEQAEALKIASSTGYIGYVVDVEKEFDGKAADAQKLFQAFRMKLNDLITADSIYGDFKLYCTTWGNPEDHNFPILAINPFVDAFMPQTYVENWGTTYMSQPAYWIRVGNEEFQRLGATKPLHHIVSTEKDIISVSQIHEFIEASGPESSIWVIPGNNTNKNIWKTWRQVDWNKNFCMTGSSEPYSQDKKIQLIPNPSTDYITLVNKGLVLSHLELKDVSGRLVKKYDWNHVDDPTTIQISDLAPGVYFLCYYYASESKGIQKIIKL